MAAAERTWLAITSMSEGPDDGSGEESTPRPEKRRHRNFRDVAVDALAAAQPVERDPPAKVVQLRPKAGKRRSAGGASSGGAAGGEGDGEPQPIDLADEYEVAVRFLGEDFFAKSTMDPRLMVRTLWRYGGELYRFEGGTYQRVEDEEIRGYISRKVNRSLVFGKDGTIAKGRATARKSAAILQMVKDEVCLPRGLQPPCWLPPADAGLRPEPEFIWHVANGLLHLGSLKLVKPTPEFFGLQPSKVVWDGKAPPPVRFLSFLSEAFGDDVESVTALQEAMGYSLFPDTSLQRIFAVIGPPRTGKSVVGNLLKELVGVEYAHSPSLNSLGEHFGLEPLIGKRIAVVVDSHLGSTSNHAEIIGHLLKISGEDHVGVPRKYKSQWHGRLGTKIWLIGNELPALKDTTNALAARMLVIPMTRCVAGREDPHLLEKLLRELPGIARWAVEGRKRLGGHDSFAQPESGRELISLMRAAASDVQGFVADRCRLDLGGWLTSDALFSEYLAWRDTEGLDRRVSRAMFAMRLHSAFPSVKRVQQRERIGRRRIYTGIRLRKDGEDDGSV